MEREFQIFNCFSENTTLTERLYPLSTELSSVVCNGFVKQQEKLQWVIDIDANQTKDVIM